MLRVFLVIDDYNELVYLQTLLKKLGFDVEGAQSQRKFQDLSLGFNPQILIVTARSRRVDVFRLANSLKRPRGVPRIIALKGPGQVYTSKELEDSGIDRLIETPVNIKVLIETIADLGNLDSEALFEKYSKIKGIMGESASDKPVTDFEVDAVGLDDPAEERRKLGELAALREDLGIISSADPEESDDTQFVSGGTGPTDESQFVTGEFSAQETQQIRGDYRDPRSQPIVTSSLSSEDRRKKYDEFLKQVEPIEEKHFPHQTIKEFNRKIRGQMAEIENSEELESSRQAFVRALFSKA